MAKAVTLRCPFLWKSRKERFETGFSRLMKAILHQFREKIAPDREPCLKRSVVDVHQINQNFGGGAVNKDNNILSSTDPSQDAAIG